MQDIIIDVSTLYAGKARLIELDGRKNENSTSFLV